MYSPAPQVCTGAKNVLRKLRHAESYVESPLHCSSEPKASNCTHSQTRARTYAHKYTNVHTQTCAYIQTHADTHSCTHEHTHAHTNEHTCTYTHTQSHTHKQEGGLTTPCPLHGTQPFCGEVRLRAPALSAQL